MSDTLHIIKDYFLSWIEEWGDLGLFLFSYTESIFQPFPVDPIIIAAVAAGEDVHMIIFWASLGAVLGAITSYYLGKFLGEPVFLKLFKKKHYKKGHEFFERWGVYAVLIGAISPIPFKVVAWLAGIFEMPFSYFLFMVFLGRVGRFMLVGYATWLFV